MSLPEPIPARDPRDLVLEERAIAPRLALRRPDVSAPDFIETMRKLWRHRGVLLLSALSCAALAGLVATWLPTRYMAEARVLVGVPELKVVNIESIISNLS